MHEIEPHYNWRQLYVAADDPQSPFYGREYSEFELSQAIYNHYIHPQWDNFGSNTLYMKILFTDYDKHFCIIELLGEWNDAIYNDVMYLYRNVVEDLIGNDIKYFILIGENILEYHSDSTDYYEEWFDNLDSDGWIIGLNFREHVIREFADANIDYYLAFGGNFDELTWRSLMPDQLFENVEKMINKRLQS